MTDTNPNSTNAATGDSESPRSPKKVLYIGGHGKIALLATPMLAAAGHEVHSLVRNPDYTEELTALGATAVIADITKLTPEQWADLFEQFDDVIWGAGNGGRGGVEVTWAVDRDGALAAVAGLEKLQEAGRKLPRFIMISYFGSATNVAENDGGSWYAYVESKKVVDLRLAETSLPHIILGPSTLTDAPQDGIRVLSSQTEPEGAKLTTARENVAAVVAEVVSRDEFPAANPLEFVDGEDPISSI